MFTIKPLKTKLYNLQRRFYYGNNETSNRSRAVNVVSGIVALTSLYTVVRLARSSFATIPTGCVGYTSLYGKLSSESYEPGYHIINPFKDMVVIPLTQQNHKVLTTTCSNEGLTIQIVFNIIYSLRKEYCEEIFINYGNKYYEILIEPYLKSIVRDTISNYEAKSLYHKETRENINSIINNKMDEYLKKKGIKVSNILINDIELPKELVKSIENKLKTEQENEQMDFIIQMERKQINFSIEKEKKEAERKIIEAEGIQKFQSIVTSGISDKLLHWKGIEATKDLVKSPNAKIVIIGNSTNGLPLIFNTEK